MLASLKLKMSRFHLRQHSWRPWFHALFHSTVRAHRAGISPGWRHAATLPRAPPYRRSGCADSRKEARGGRLEHFTSLIWAFRRRTSGKAAVRSAKAGPTDKPFPCSAAQVSLCGSASSRSLREVREVAWKVAGATLVTASGTEGRL